MQLKNSESDDPLFSLVTFLFQTSPKYGEWVDQKEYKDLPFAIAGDMDWYEPKDNETDDCFYQQGDLYRLIIEDKKVLLIENTVRNMEGVTMNIK